MATKLGLYNHALRNLGEGKLATVTDDIEKRYLLDDVYDNGLIRKCLEEGLWNFAIRTVEVSYEPSIEPDFGYPYAFDKPSDYVITAAISAAPFFDPPLLSYDDEGAYWYCSHQTIYVKYVSDDAAWGSDLTAWTESFEEFASWKLANGVVGKLTGMDPEKVGYCESKLKRALSNARSKDALNQPTKFASRGSWVNSRGGGSRNDRGNGGSLIG